MPGSSPHVSGSFSARSFRDPGGVVVFVDEMPYRLIRKNANDVLDSFLATPAAESWMTRGALVTTDRVSAQELHDLLEKDAFGRIFNVEPWAEVVRHESIFFASYPEEWTAGMLYAAADLTLDFAGDLLDQDWGLKDATPHNVLFRGPTPVFVDVLSAQPLERGVAVWLPYAQFARSFLIPLLVHRHTRRPLRALYSTGPEGIEPPDAFKALSLRSLVRPAALSLVTLPVLLHRLRGDDAAIVPQRRVADDRARFVLATLFRQLRWTLRSVRPTHRPSSAWIDYTEAEHGAAYHTAKQNLVAEIVARTRPRYVLDIGCNTGELSLVAARGNASVVAIDADADAVEQTWRRAREEQLDVLPLVVDITDPTPGRGWANRERASFLERAAGRFDAVLAMAVLHHLMTAGVPLRAVIDLLASLTRDLVVVEFVPPTDLHFRRLARGRDESFAGLTRDVFEAAIARRFDVIQQVPLPVEGRIAYVLRKR